MIYPELKNNLGYFLKLFRLSRKEGLTPENIIGFLNMAANLQKLNEKFHFHLNEVKDLELKKSQCKEQLEILRKNKRSTREQLSDTERAANRSSVNYRKYAFKYEC
jgi:hypothetical protein